mmetsp:Transcript_14748/g.42471  ORF Transcript_14748/g.42471 Transcript_14748/m.42471 type:complete len:182 (+) Transcript_14748:315-860(+)
MAGKCGKFLIALMFSALTIAAIVFSCLTVAACDYVTYLDDQGERKMAGLFKFEVPGEVDGECVTYTESEVDSLTNLEKTAMVCGFLAPCFAIVALALATLELFLCDKCCIGLFVSILFSFATIAQSLTFMFLRSESFCSVTGCNMGDGAIYSIVAVSVMFVAGCTLGCIPKSEPLLIPSEQ